MSIETFVAYALSSVRSIYLSTGASSLPECRDFSPVADFLRAMITKLEESSATTLDCGFGEAEYERLDANQCVPESSMRLHGIPSRARIGTPSAGRSGLTRLSQSLPQGREFAAEIKRARRRRLEGRA